MFLKRLSFLLLRTGQLTLKKIFTWWTLGIFVSPRSFTIWSVICLASLDLVPAPLELELLAEWPGNNRLTAKLNVKKFMLTEKLITLNNFIKIMISSTALICYIKAVNNNQLYNVVYFVCFQCRWFYTTMVRILNATVNIIILDFWSCKPKT